MSRHSSSVGAALSNGWDAFWFTPKSPKNLALLRLVTGLLATVWLASFSFEIVPMFSADGYVSLRLVHAVQTGGDPTQPLPGLSHLFWIDAPWLIWIFHAFAILVALSMTLGIAPLWSTPATLLVTLSYIHRGPLLSNLFESVLCMLLLYLSFAPPVSVRTLRRRPESARPTWQAGVVQRLIQVHLCGFYLLGGLSKLGSTIWWNGEAAWFIISDRQHRLVDLTSLAGVDFSLDAITHFWILFELAFPILIWNRSLRPGLLLVSGLWWSFVALATGLVGFAVAMAVAGIAFWPREEDALSDLGDSR